MLLLRGVSAAGLVVQSKAEINGFAVAFHSASVFIKCLGPFPERFRSPEIAIFVCDQVACPLEGVNEIRAHSFLTEPFDDLFACDIIQGFADRPRFSSVE